MSDSDTSYVEFCQCDKDMNCQFDTELKIWYCYPEKDNYYYRIYYDNKIKKSVFSYYDKKEKIWQNIK